MVEKNPYYIVLGGWFSDRHMDSSAFKNILKQTGYLKQLKLNSIISRDYSIDSVFAASRDIKHANSKISEHSWIYQFNKLFKNIRSLHFLGNNNVSIYV